MRVNASDGTTAGGYLGYTGGWEPVVALIEALETAAPDATRDLLREAHRAGLVTSFDWPTWMTGRGRELAGNPDAIAEATLEECRRLLVAHLRRDRFVTGHLADVIASGEVTAILRRAEAITAARAAAPPGARLPLTTSAPATMVPPRSVGPPSSAAPAASSGAVTEQARPIHPDDAGRPRTPTTSP